MRASRTLLVVSVTFLSALTSVAGAGSAQPGKGSTLEQKLDHIRTNSTRQHPDPAPTVLSESEINRYFASPEAKLPAGVRSVTFQAQPGVITGSARVDFDEIKSGTRSSSALLQIFTGVHDVVVVAHARGRGGQGFVDIDSATGDGVEIPRFLLQLFVDKYITSKYPQIGLQSRFTLPNRIDTAVVGLHKLTVTQK